VQKSESLAELVCAAKGYRVQIVSSDAFSREKLDHMAALGAELTLVPSEGGLTTRKLILAMIEAARRLSQEPHTYWTDQLNNHDSIAGYYSLGEEIWSQTKGEIDAFVHCEAHQQLLVFFLCKILAGSIVHSASCTLQSACEAGGSVKPGA